MPSAFPTALDTLATNKSDATASATDHAQHHNDLASAVNNVEAELGTDPSGSFLTVAARFAAQSTARKTADQTDSTATFVNVTDLAFPVTVGADHFFEFFVPYSSSATTTGVGFAVTVPALGSGGYLTYTVEVSGRSANPAVGVAPTIAQHTYHTHHQASGGGTAAASDSVAVANTVYLARIHGILTNPSAAGSLQVQWRSETAVASTVKKGSFGRMYVN